VRLWQQDFNDMIGLFTQAECVLEIDDKDRIYTDVEDFLKDSSSEITNIRIIGKSRDYDGNLGLRIYISADRFGIYANCTGDISKAASLSNNLKFLFDRRTKRFAHSVRSTWLPLILLPILLLIFIPIDIAFYYAQKSKSGSWEVFVINMGMVIPFTYLFERFRGSVRKTDLWFRKTPTTDTYWSRNRDKLITDTLRALIVTAVTATFVAIVGVVIRRLILNH
jgi:hypothetical protein